MSERRFGIFNVEADVSSIGVRWEEYKKQFKNYIVAKTSTKFASIDDEVLKCSFLDAVGTRVFQMYSTKGQDTDKYKDVVDILDKFFVKQINTDFEKYQLLQIKQTKNEPFDNFVNKLRVQAAKCNFTNVDAEVRTQLIYGCYNKDLRVEALSKTKTLDELIALGRSYETAETQAEKILEENTGSVAAVSYNKTNKSIFNNINNRNNNSNRNKSKFNNNGSGHGSGTNKRSCGFCGGYHEYGKQFCKAHNQKCKKCGGFNHFAKVCKSKIDKQKHQVNKVTVEATGDSGAVNSGYMFAISDHLNGLPTTKVSINDSSLICMFIDTCCTLNVIDEGTYDSLKPRPTLKRVYGTAWGYQNTVPIKFLGEFECKLKCHNREIETKVAVVEGSEKCLLGYRACDELGIVKIINSIKEARSIDYWKELFPNVFSGKLGKLKDLQIEIDVDDTIKSTCDNIRPIPFHMREKMDEIVKKGLEEDVFEEAKGPTTWLLNPMLIPKPDGRIRFVVDASPVNVAIKRTRYVLPTIEDLITDINGATIFSKIDFVDGFHQIELSEKSRHLTTFKTHSGLYRYKRSVQGFTNMPEKFHEIIKTKVINGLQGVRSIFDDILVYSNSIVEHEKHLFTLFERLNSLNLTVNIKKCQLAQKSVEFFGLIFTSNGISLNFDKVQALRDAAAPTTPGEVSSLLGLSTYCSRFIKDHATITDPLRRLIKSKADWKLGKEEEEALKQLKEAATGDILAYYNTKFNTELVVDASPVGLGAILVQIDPNDKNDVNIVAYASRSLTDIEKRYSQIEKECLAMVWGVEKFHIYLYGRNFTIVTDNKALEYIFKCRKKKVPARIERWSIRLAQYDFKVKHRPGIGNPADYLSRKPLPDTTHDNDGENYINYLFNESIPKSIVYDDIVKATNEDGVLQELIRRIRGAKFNKENRKSIEFDHAFHELSVTNNNVVMRGTKIVIPESLREKIITIAHEGHLGITKTKALLRTKTWFPRLDSLVEKHIGDCFACQINHPKTYYEPLKMSEIPHSPFENVCIDFYGPTPSNTELLVLYDEYSRFVVVKELFSTKAEFVIPELHDIFTTIAIPKNLKSDNGQPFSSSSFARFCEHFGIKHRLITPYWPRANGEVERFNRNLSKVMKNADACDTSWRKELNEFLGAYRATPHQSTGVPPASLIFKFNQTARLSQIYKDRIFEKTEDDYLAVEKDQLAKQKMEYYGNKHLKVKQCDFKVGDLVFYNDPKFRFKKKTRSKRNKETYKITNIQGSMITVSSTSNNNTITRNSSCFIRTNYDIHNNSANNARRFFRSYSSSNNSNLAISPSPPLNNSTRPSDVSCQTSPNANNSSNSGSVNNSNIGNSAIGQRTFTRANRGTIDRFQANFNKKSYN